MSAKRQQSNEDQLFRRVKFGILLMLAVFSMQIFTFLPQYWPLTRWRMFSGSREMPAITESFQVQVTDTQGQTYNLFPPELGFISSRIIQNAFVDGPEYDQYQKLLFDRVQAALPDVEIVTMVGLHNTYNVSYTEMPPFDLMQPAETETLGTISLDGSAGETSE